MNVVIIAGVETIRYPNGRVKKYSDTFLDNSETWRHENPGVNLVILDARKYIQKENPIKAIWKAVFDSFPVLDKLIYFGHSSSESLICFSHVRTELSIEERYFRSGFHYIAPWSKDASIYIYGCRAGGDGQKSSNSIAQIIANKTNKKVWAFINKSYQKEGPKGHYHQVSDDKIGLVEFIPLKGILIADSK